MNDRPDSAVSEARDVPTLRVLRDRDGSISMFVDEIEWHSRAEAADFSTWLAPVMDIFVDHDAIARGVGTPVLSSREMAEHLAGTARCLLGEGGLFQLGGRWRFRGGVAPDDASAAERGDA